MITAATWSRVWNALDAKKVTDQDAEDITQEVNRHFQYQVSDYEASEALRWICERRRTGVDEDGEKVARKYMERLGGSALISAIIRLRWQAKRERGEHYIEEACNRCNGSGWISFSYLDGNPIRIVPNMTPRAYSASCPCECQKGQARLAVAIQAGKTTAEKYGNLINLVNGGR
jgi:hypothetical protein